MAYVYQGGVALDYAPCRYGTSRAVFRGPARDLEKPYVAVLGGIETYGKFVPEPFPALLEAKGCCQVVNLGAVNAGPDLFLEDSALRGIVAGAEAVVVQVMGAQNLSNRFYRVHRRRNDRFLGATAALRQLFPEVDFTDFSFTRHMLQALQRSSAECFEEVATELRNVWLRRMAALLALAPGRTVLLYFAGHRPPRAGRPADLHRDPLLVDAEMILQLRPQVRSYQEVIAADDPVQALLVPDLERAAALSLPGRAAHAEVAARLHMALTQMLK